VATAALMFGGAFVDEEPARDDDRDVEGFLVQLASDVEDSAPGAELRQCTVARHLTISDPADSRAQVLTLHLAGRLGYLRAADEWVDLDEPLPDELQDAAHQLVEAGLLPEFEDVTGAQQVAGGGL
jgi:hypothetical protein